MNFVLNSRNVSSKNNGAKRKFALVLSSFFAFAFLLSTPAFASDVRDIADSVTGSAQNLPGVIAVAAYLMGILLGVLGIIKIKDSVVNPQQFPLKDGIARLGAGGALFALPIVYEAMFTAINGGGLADPGAIMTADFNAALGFVGLNDVGGGNPRFNDILKNVAESTKTIPGVIMAVTYLLGLIAGFAGILKLKEHIENPQQVAIREPIVRFLTGGAFFALPMIIEALLVSIDDGSGGFSLANIFGAGLMGSEWTGGTITGCGGGVAAGTTVDVVICNIVNGTEAFPAFLVTAAYLFGLFLAVWGILKLRDHVLNPQQIPVWDGIMRMLAAGAFFALPMVVEAAHRTITEGLGAVTNSGDSGAIVGTGLDAVMFNFVDSIFAPMTVLMNFFGLVAGMILVMVAISRLVKSTQEGARGPGGIGTIMTFLAGGALISFLPMLNSFTGSLFDDNVVNTIPDLQYTTGMDPAVIAHSEAVVSAIIRFMIVLGLISFARGIFIVRGVAEGNSQASLMAGVTHLVGGALAVNLGPLVNAVQETLGLSAYGVVFN